MEKNDDIDKLLSDNNIDKLLSDNDNYLITCS